MNHKGVNAITKDKVRIVTDMITLRVTVASTAPSAAAVELGGTFSLLLASGCVPSKGEEVRCPCRLFATASPDIALAGECLLVFEELW